MYYLSLRLGNRVTPSLRRYSMNNLDKYVKLAKKADLKLTQEELYNSILK
jgi:hypothetical protein